MKKRYKDCCKEYLNFNKELSDCESVWDIAYLTTRNYYKGRMTAVRFCPVCGRNLKDD